MYVNEDFDTSSFFSEKMNPLICTVIQEVTSQKAVSFDDSGDLVVPMDSRPHNPHSVLIDDFPDYAGEGSMLIKLLLDADIEMTDDLRT